MEGQECIFKLKVIILHNDTPNSALKMEKPENEKFTGTRGALVNILEKTVHNKSYAPPFHVRRTLSGPDG